MPETPEGPLVQMARSIQTRHQKFLQELTSAAREAASNPTAALATFDQCWNQADQLEKEQLELLAQMSLEGSEQIAQTKDGWREDRLQILVSKAQVLVILARYDDAQAAIESARSYLSDADHPAAGILDELDISIIQLKG